ncbi:MAG: PrsW family glutamic-type intramembrane protease, partial [Planctomycetota bacterium]
MTEPSKDPRIEGEPHLRGLPLQPDKSEQRVYDNQRHASPGPPKIEQQLQHSVWDEPGLSTELLETNALPELTYRNWLQRRRSETGWGRSWAVTLLVALLAGPWAVIGALWGTGQTLFSIVTMVVFAPLVEEMMKMAAALFIVEQKPYLFLSPVQIIICALASGFIFAAIENLLYIYVYVNNPSTGLIYWRWTVCVALHTCCSGIAGLG